MASIAPTAPGSPVTTVAAGWRAHLASLAMAWLGIIVLFASDSADMAGIWWNSSTFTHCLLLPFIIGWLIWQRVPEMGEIRPAIWWPGLIWMGAGAFAWLLGDAASIGLFRHAGVIVMLQGAVIVLMGQAVSRAIAFPLFYMLFMVPAGEELVAPMQTLTAKMCMVMLDWVDIPAHIEGIFITIPTGYFKVAEACSGVKFLVAMFAYAVLVANVCFLSWYRRIAFVLFSLVTSVVANGIRAWGTIYISHLTSIEFASGFDHVFYGWFFFGFVMVVVMAAGWKFFDRPVHALWLDSEKMMVLSAKGRHGGLWLGGVGVALVALSPVMWSTAIAASGREVAPATVALPVIKGWHRVSTPIAFPWHARYKGADHYLQARFADDKNPNRVVELAIAYFAYQEEGREVVGYGQGAVAPDSRWAWTDKQPAPTNGMAFRMTAPGPVIREVVTFYQLGSLTSGNPMAIKLATLRARLLGGSQRAMAVIVTAEQRGNQSARPAIDAFLTAMGPIDNVVDQVVANQAAKGSLR